MVFNQCIGAGNELLYLLFLLSVVNAQLVGLIIFLIPSPDDPVVTINSKILFYAVNIYVLWLASIESL